MYGSYSLMKCLSDVVRFDRQNDSLIHGLQNGCSVWKHKNNFHLVIDLHQSTWPGALSNSSTIFKGIFFFFFFFSWVGCLNSGLKIFGKPWHKQTLLFFVVPFIEHRKTWFRIILKSPQIGLMVVSTGFNLKSPVSWAPSKRFSLQLKLWSQALTCFL